jgi:dipeptidyl aminopeptidase/acylaminoacyl peptidase
MSRPRSLRWVLQLLSFLPQLVWCQEPKLGRPMVPADLLSIRHYGTISVSPDGQLIAIEIKRSRHDEEGRDDFVSSVSRKDLWIVSRDGKSRRDLTPPRAGPGSTWGPEWSPSGSFLAYLSIDKRANAFVNIWERSSGQIRQVAPAADLAAEVSSISASYAGPICWLDSTHIVVVVLAKGSQSLVFHEDTQSVAIAHAGLRAADRGRVSTAVVVSSPPDSETTTSDRKVAHLIVVDARTGRSRLIAGLPLTQTRLAHRLVVISRTGRYAAIVTHAEPQSADPAVGWYLQSAYPAHLGVVPLTDGTAPSVRWIAGLVPFVGRNNTDQLILSWRQDDSLFAVFEAPHLGGPTAGADTSQTPFALALVNPRSGEWRKIATVTANHYGTDDSLDPHALRWTDDDRILVRRGSAQAWFLVHGDSLDKWNVSRDSLSATPRNSVRKPGRFQRTADGRLYEIDRSERERTLFPPINPRLDEIEPPHYLVIRYATAHGDSLSATVLLPYDYIPGHHYPAIVYVYAGDVTTDVERIGERDDDTFLNMLLLASRGYVVMKPSMPLETEGTPSDPMLRLNDGVEPAVNRLVDIGIADSSRLGLVGHSFGGYSVYGLIAQTRRYKAAIAMDGISDLFSAYGQFDPRHRYTEPNAAATMWPLFEERFQGRMALAPWEDPARYLRNSPILFVDRITTPLLIFHGDIDFIADQDEQLFTGLYRLGRRAEFVRYLGERHSVDSPANLLDLWARIYNWFDTYLAPNVQTTGQ